MVRRNPSLADQVILEIVSRIDDGSLARENGLIPSEAELSHLFFVSRATVREALGKLELTGMIIRRHGVGTFVNQFLSKQPTAVRDWFDVAHGFAEALRTMGKTVGSRFLRTETRPAGDLASFLEVAEEELVFSVEKLILVSNVPAIHSFNALPFSLISESYRDLVSELAEQTESIFQFLERFCNAHVHHQQSEVRATLVGPTLAPLIECPASEPCLRVEEVAYSHDMRPLFYGLNHFRADLVSFRQIRRPSYNALHSLPDQGSENSFGGLQ